MNQVMTMYHGTSKENAQSIQRTGFRTSSGGNLGPGVYLACSRKAYNFAKDAKTRVGGSGGGAVLECRVTLRNCLLLRIGDQRFDPSYDATYATRTGRSTKPEWCIQNPRDVVVVKVYYLDNGFPSHLKNHDNPTSRLFAQQFSSSRHLQDFENTPATRRSTVSSNEPNEEADCDDEEPARFVYRPSSYYGRESYCVRQQSSRKDSSSSESDSDSSSDSY